MTWIGTSWCGCVAAVVCTALVCAAAIEVASRIGAMNALRGLLGGKAEGDDGEDS